MILYNLFNILLRIWNKFIISPIIKSTFASCGKRVNLGRKLELYRPQNIHAGNDIGIGANSLFMCTRAKIYIGDHVMFGPGVSVITGGHRIDIIGKYMTSVTNEEKLPENDQDIIFKGDNWIGANATILKGVTIGKGSVIAAGAVITNNVPEYSVWGGIPACFIKNRFKDEDLIMHKKIINEKQI